MLRFVLDIRDNFPTRRNILETNQSPRRTREPFENNNKRSQGRLSEGGPLRGYFKCFHYGVSIMTLWRRYLLRRACFSSNLVILHGTASCEGFAIKHVKYVGKKKVEIQEVNY